ncbi:MAG TPA: lytic transglycosylase domain-containing protein [Devosia sp.]|nr:lytic transglycosylase domain-containing protein [Devosia sp.]
MRLIVAIFVTAAFAVGPAAAAPAPAAPPAAALRCHGVVTDDGKSRRVCIGEARYFRDVCRAIALYAGERGLPEGFFARLIWQESRFDPGAISRAGAQGIAQFIPSTARLRGLQNAFDPAEALARSAEYLSFLRTSFGSLGLAAAAYNAGEGRLSRYTSSGGGFLPAETEDYVEIITGQPAAVWLNAPPSDVDFALSRTVRFEPACIEMAKAAPMPRLDLPPGEWHPWGVLIAQDFSQAKARRIFERVQRQYDGVLGEEKLMLLTGRNRHFGNRLRHFAMIGRDSRKEALELCRTLTRAGGVCTVVEN